MTPEQTEMTDEIMIPEALRHFLPIWVVLGRPPDSNAYKGLVEQSFSMGWSDSDVQLYWSGTAYSFLGEHKMDGKKDAAHQLSERTKGRPGWTIEMFDVTSSECPILIDWDRWAIALEKGIRDKYGSRNARFIMKES